MSGIARIALIVEGHGEIQAAPQLVRRILAQEQIAAVILKPHRVPKGKMPSQLDSAVRFQSYRVEEVGGVLVLVDADSDSPEGLKTSLLSGISADLRPTTRIVVAIKEYEAWFLAGIESLRGHRSVRDDAAFPGDPESPQDAKGRLQEQMTESYQETIHQVAFSSVIDLDAVAASSPSFVAFRSAVLALATP